jgi:hypothetical protein
VLNTFPFCFGKHNRTLWNVKMPGGHTLAHRAGWLIIRADRQTKTEKDMQNCPADTRGDVCSTCAICAAKQLDYELV